MSKRMDWYHRIRPFIRTGDVIGATTPLLESRVIRATAGGPITHVSIVLEVAPIGASDRAIVTTMEAQREGVVPSRLSARVEQYRRWGGWMWWLPVRADLRNQMDVPRMVDWLLRQEGKRYDFWQAALSPWKWWWGEENYNRFFCSELACGALEAARILPSHVNCSKCTPRKLYRYNIFETPFQFLGKEWRVKKYGDIHIVPPPQLPIVSRGSTLSLCEEE